MYKTNPKQLCTIRQKSPLYSPLPSQTTFLQAFQTVVTKKHVILQISQFKRYEDTLLMY